MSVTKKYCKYHRVVLSSFGETNHLKHITVCNSSHYMNNVSTDGLINELLVRGLWSTYLQIIFCLICLISFIFSDDKKRHFQLNICAPVKNGACPKDSLICEINDKSTLLQPFLSNSVPKMTTSFDKLTQNVLLKYATSNETVSLEFVCDRSANLPVVKVKISFFFQHK